MMEFVPLRSLQRGLPEVWQTLRKENGRIILTNKGQPAYLLVDLADKDIINLINFFDDYQAKAASATCDPKVETSQKLTPQEEKAAQNFLAAMQTFRETNFTPEVLKAFTELESGKYRPKLFRELDL
ncbi:MAG: hypothetical protein LBU32_05975 [Clostridiales bacterium]|jgi:hypothetical protein|nr:hypothetical protein [Clostridiales bacterium]